MTNPTQLSTHTPDQGAMYAAYRSFAYVTAFLLCLAEVIAIVLLVKRWELSLNNTVVYILPFLIPLPGLEGIRTYRQIKASFAAGGQLKDVPRVVWQALAVTVASAYVALIFALVLIVDCLRASGRHF